MLFKSVCKHSKKRDVDWLLGLDPWVVDSPVRIQRKLRAGFLYNFVIDNKSVIRSHLQVLIKGLDFRESNIASITTSEKNEPFQGTKMLLEQTETLLSSKFQVFDVCLHAPTKLSSFYEELGYISIPTSHKDVTQFIKILEDSWS